MVLKITEEKDPIKQSTKVPQSVGVNSSNSINKKNSLPLLQSNKQQRNKSCHLPQILPHKMSNHFSFSVFPHNRVLKTSPNFFLRFLGKTIIRVRIVDSYLARPVVVRRLHSRMSSLATNAIRFNCWPLLVFWEC